MKRSWNRSTSKGVVGLTIATIAILSVGSFADAQTAAPARRAQKPLAQNAHQKAYQKRQVRAQRKAQVRTQVQAKAQAQAATQAVKPQTVALAPSTLETTAAAASINAEVTPPKIETQKTNVRWRISTSATQWENQYERVQSVGLGLTLDFQREFNQSFLIKAVAGASMKSGYVQTRFGEMSARNSIWLSEGYLQGKAGSVLTVRGGIINQGAWNATTVIDGGSFPGALQIIRFGEDYYAEIKAGQSIPVSAKMDAKTTDTEPTPTFMVETLKIGLEPKKGWLWVSAFGGHWAFHRLPSMIASDSDVGGNTLVDEGGKKRFKYEFEGWLAGASGQINFTERTNIEAHIQVSKNNHAPDAYGAGQIAGGGVTIGLPGNVDLNTVVDFYFAESDASPAYYNSVEYGHNNREGMGVTIGANFKEQGFRISGIFTDAKVINPHPLQERQQFYLLSFGTNYAAF